MTAPDSFHPTRSGAKVPRAELTAIPRSWLKPAVVVQRSALPLRMARQSPGGVIESFKLAASTSPQARPAVVGNAFCVVLLASLVASVAFGMKYRVRLVGEYLPPIGPAPA